MKIKTKLLIKNKIFIVVFTLPKQLHMRAAIQQIKMIMIGTGIKKII